MADPKIFIGLLIGGAVPFLFSALAIRAVGRPAGVVVQEVRRQFADGKIMAGTKRPDYGPVIDICTAASLRELATPALLAVLTPVIIGFGINYLALGAFLAAVILTGQLMANFLSNAGGAWDNAKKYIEDGHEGGKGSEAHKAAVIGDTVGDPFKDTAGPALNPLIKVMNLVSLLTLPAIINLQDNDGARFTIAGVALVVLIGAIAFSKRKARGDGRRRAAPAPPLRPPPASEGASPASPERRCHVDHGSREISGARGTPSNSGHASGSAMSLRELFRARPDDADPLGRHATDAHPGVEGKEEAEAAEEADAEALGDLQERLFAEGRRALLLVLQGMDTSGKSGVIKHVGTVVQPARHPRPGLQAAERRGAGPRLPVADPPGSAGPRPRRGSSTGPTTRTCSWCGSTGWCPRRCGGAATPPSTGSRRNWPTPASRVVKCLLHISYEYQRERLLARLEDPTKRWKFNEADVEERGHWPALPGGLRRRRAALQPGRPLVRRPRRPPVVPEVGRQPDPVRDAHRDGPPVPHRGRPRRRSPQKAPGRDLTGVSPGAEFSRRAFRTSRRTGRSESKHDEADDRQQVLVDVGHRLAQDVAEARHPDGPQQAAEDVEGHERAVLHGPHPGQDRGERPHDRDEPGQDDGLGAVTLEVLAGLVDVLLLEDPGVGPPEQRRGRPGPEGVADLVAGHGGHEAPDAG